MGVVARPPEASGSPPKSSLLATATLSKAGRSRAISKLIGVAPTPDGVLIRNLGAIEYFTKLGELKKTGDFSVSVANPLTARLSAARKRRIWMRVTISYDLDIDQVLALLRNAPPRVV